MKPFPFRPAILALAVACGGNAAPDPHPSAPDAHLAKAHPKGSHEDAGDLKTIMGALGREMASLQGALWVEDFAALTASASAIADHAHVSPTERTRVAAALGDDFAGFATADRTVHDAAVQLAEAARAEDLDATLSNLAAVQAGCTSCHTAFRDRLATPPSSP